MKMFISRFFAALLFIPCLAMAQQGTHSTSTDNYLSELGMSVQHRGSDPAPQATGRSYLGADLGLTYNWYSGQSNFFWPITASEPDGSVVSTYAAFDGLGSGIGGLLGLKAGLALSNSWDLEAKLRYLTNYTAATEDHKIPINLSGIPGGPTTPEPVTNSYNLLFNNLDFDVLAHFGLNDSWYLAGGLSFSSLLSNRLYVNQVKNGGDDWSYYNSGTTGLTGDTSATLPASNQSNFFASSRTGLLLGAGTIFPLGNGSPLLDAELLFSVPLSNWLQSSGESTINDAAAFYNLPAVTFPRLWYASLTIGIRFPFKSASEAPVAYSSPEVPGQSNQGIGSDGKVALTGTVKNAKTGKPVDATMTVVDLTNNEVVATDQTHDGKYNVRVKAPGKYSVTADADGYLFGTAYFQVDDQGRILSHDADIKLSETSGGRTRLLVFFDFNSATLKSSSYPELNRAVRLMKAIPKMKVQIAGYTDSIGSDEYNRQLSQHRAEAVRNYLVQNGIAATRVMAHGYGKESPIADNGTDEGRSENRRVEFVVLSD